MSLEPADQSRLGAFKIFLIGVALASAPDSASAAQRKANHAMVWGPMFKSQVERCWKKPNGGDATAEAAFKISLTRDGMLAEQPVAEKPAATDYDKSYQESAVKSLNACQPYKLPIEYYDEWKLFVPVFSEKRAVGAFAPTPTICRGC